MCFNRVVLLVKGDGMIWMTQKYKITKLRAPRTEELFESQRALPLYIGAKFRLDVCTAVQLIAPGRKAICDAQFKISRKSVDHFRIQVILDITLSSSIWNHYMSWCFLTQRSQTHPGRKANSATSCLWRLMSDNPTSCTPIPADSTACIAR